MPNSVPLKHIPNDYNVNGAIQRLLDGEDPTNKGLYEQHQTSNLLSEDELLWYDVLELAVTDYKQTFLATRVPLKNIFSAVFDWFFNEHLNFMHIGSFEAICLNLSINPSVVRKKLVLWTKKAYSEKDAESLLQEDVTKPTIVSTLYVIKNDII